jgi:hypothetical protein
LHPIARPVFRVNARFSKKQGKNRKDAEGEVGNAEINNPRTCFAGEASG